MAVSHLSCQKYLQTVSNFQEPSVTPHEEVSFHSIGCSMYTMDLFFSLSIWAQEGHQDGRPRTMQLTSEPGLVFNIASPYLL